MYDIQLTNQASKDAKLVEGAGLKNNGPQTLMPEIQKIIYDVCFGR
jgi:hypothetical protein